MMKENNFEIHSRENNDASEDFLNENYDKFSKQCVFVLKLLKSGERLSVPKALGLGIMSLPRRIMDLKVNGIEIKDEWIKDTNGKRIMKEWFIELPKEPTKESAQEFWNNYLE